MSEASGFSFLSTTTVDDPTIEAPTESASSSSFSFLNQHGEIDQPEIGEEVSSFGFLASGGSVEESDSATTSSASAFSFMDASIGGGNAVLDEPDLLGAVVSPSNQEIKLGKVAQAKQVRKKKKASRVGFGRDDDTEDPDTTGLTQEQPMMPASILPQPAPLPSPGNAPLPVGENFESPHGDAAVVQDEIIVKESAPRQALAQASQPIAPSAAVQAVAPQAVAPQSVAPQAVAPQAQPVQQKRSSVFGWFGMRSDAQQTAASSPHHPPQQAASQPQHVSNQAPPQVAVPYASKPVDESLVESVSTTSTRRPSVNDIPIAPPAYKPEPPVTPQIQRKQVPVVAEQSAEAPVASSLSVPMPPTVVADVPIATPPPPPIAEVSLSNLCVATVSKPVEADETPVRIPVSHVAAAEDFISETLTANAKINSLFLEKVQTICNDYNSRLAVLNTLRGQLANCRNDISKGNMRLSELEAEQQRLAQLEAFEEADEVTTRMDVIRAAISQSKLDIESIVAEETSVLGYLSVYRIEMCSDVDRYSAMLKDLREQQTKNVERLNDESSKELEAVEEKLVGEEDRVSTEIKHLRREEEVMIEESSTIEAAISSQSGKLTDEKIDLDARLLGLTTEIQQLEQQLAHKRAEAKSVSEQLKGVEDRLGDVRKKYDRQLHRINDRQSTVATALAECLKEEEIFSQQRNNLESQKHQLVESFTKIEEWCKSVDLSMDHAVVVKQVLGQSCLDEVVLSFADSSGRGESPQVVSLRQEVVSAEVALASLVQSRASIEGKQATLMNEMASIDARIPSLEAEKKDHAVNKKFKEAAQVAKDIKSLSSRRDEIELELKSGSEALASTDVSIVSATNNLNSASENLKRESASMVKEKYIKYRIRIDELRRVLSRIGPVESEFSSSLVKLVENELSILSSAAEAMKVEYSLDDDVDVTDVVVASHDPAGSVNSLASSAECSECLDDIANSAEVCDGPTENVEESTSIEEIDESARQLVIENIKNLIVRRSDLYLQRDKSADDEDYEAAAEFDERAEQLSSEINELAKLHRIDIENMNL